MPKAVTVDERRYGSLLRQSLPRPIRTERAYEAMKRKLLELEELDSPSVEQRGLAELFAILIEKYEERHYPLDNLSTPRERLVALLEERGIPQARKLADHLRAPIDLFL
jgi:HTH-type transcriptional regulator/antitoxin HigA